MSTSESTGMMPEYIGTGPIRVEYAGSTVDYSVCIRIYYYKISGVVYSVPIGFSDEDDDPLEHGMAKSLELIINDVYRRQTLPAISTGTSET